MIYFFTTLEHTYTLQIFLAKQPEALQRRVRVIPYPQLAYADQLPRATYIFTDLDRLSSAQLVPINHIWSRLAADGGSVLYNDPRRVLLRRELLQLLHDAGHNPFNVRLVGDVARPMRYPTFLRPENQHEGPRTTLLRDKLAVRNAAMKMVLAGFDPAHLIECEFIDTADNEGIYRKYAALMIGGRVLPRHLQFDRSWVVKDPHLTEPHMLAEQMLYLTTNPHEQMIRSVFAMANIDYGRIDYTFLGANADRPVVWEINTNPDLMRPQKDRNPAVEPAYQLFWDSLRTTLMEMDVVENTGPVPIRWPADLASRMAAAERNEDLAAGLLPSPFRSE